MHINPVKRSGPGRPGNLQACAICGRTPLGAGGTWCSPCWAAYTLERKVAKLAGVRVEPGFTNRRRAQLAAEAARAASVVTAA